MSGASDIASSTQDPDRGVPRIASTSSPRLVILTGLDVRAYRGGEKYAATLARELRQRGSDVLLYSKIDPHEPRRLETADLPAALGVPVEFYPLVWLPLLPPFPRVPRAFLRTLRTADVLYLMESTPRFVALVVFLGRLLGRRVVVGLHHPSQLDLLARELHGGPWTRLRAFLFRSVLRSATVLHALTSYQARVLQGMGIRANVAVVNLFTPVEPARRPHPPSGVFEALFVGPLERDQKGIDLLVEVAERVLPLRPSIRLSVIGTGRDRALVEELAERFPGQVRNRGFVSETELRDAYDEADLLWLPSRAEAFPAVPLEAYAHGLPVVGFAIPGFEEISAVYPQGRVQPFDTDEFAHRVLSLHDLWSARPEEYESVRAECCASVSERFGKATQVPRLARMLGLPSFLV